MDIDALLDIEKRTGVKEDDIQAFIDRVADVEKQIKQLRDPNFELPKVDPEEEARKLAEKKRKEEERKRKELEKKEKAKREERENWWRRAELMFSSDEGEENKDENARKTEADEWANRLVASYKAKDALDYSFWDKWQPKDPVTLAEQAEQEALVEKMRDQEFEQANADFCRQFKEDMENRQQHRLSKEKEAQKLRMAGNDAFKRKMYDQALAKYQESLETDPFCVSTLVNIAQVNLRLNDLDEVIEFSNRALRVNPKSFKALSRRAAAYRLTGRLDEAVADLELASSIEPGNQDLQRERETASRERDSRREEESVTAQVEREREGQAVSQLTVAEDLVKRLMGRDSSERTPKEIREDVALMKLLRTMLTDPKTRVYMRTSGLLARIITLVAAAVKQTNPEEGTEEEQPEDSDRSKSKAEEEELVECLLLLSHSADDDSRNQELILKQLGLFSLVLLLAPGSFPVSTSAATLELLANCVYLSEWQTEILKDGFALRSILLHLPSQNPGVLASCTSVLRTLSGNNARDALSTARPCVVEKLTEIINKDSRLALPAAIRENITVTLTNISLCESKRPAFADEKVVQALSGVIRRPSNETVSGRSFAIAALMNACLEPQGLVKKTVASSGLPAYTIFVLKANDWCGLDSQAVCRLLGLLARVSSEPAARQLLRLDSSISLLAKVLGERERISTWKAEDRNTFQDHLVRVLATLFTKEADSAPCVEQFIKVGGLSVLFSFLPEPKVERERERERAGHLTLAPARAADLSQVKARTALLGNLTKMLIAIISHSEGAIKEIFLMRSTELGYVGAGIVQLALILRDLQDGPARQNAAICLASLARSVSRVSPQDESVQRKCRQALEDFRVMEMVREIGARLLAGSK